jgi:hypothetical protein
MIYALTAVNLTLNWIADGTVKVTNLSCSFGNTDCVDIPFTGASSSIGMTLTVDGVTVSPTAVAGPTSGTALYEGDGGPINIYTGQHGSGSSGNPAANLAFFEGIGNANITGSIHNGVQQYSGSANAGYPADLSFGGGAQAGGYLAVTYTFSEVAIPEPMTSALAGGALVGLALLARWKRAKKA